MDRIIPTSLPSITDKTSPVQTNKFDRLIATAVANRSISPAPQFPNVSTSLRASTRNSIKSIGLRSDSRDTDGKNGRSNLSDSMHGSVDGDNNGKNVRVTRSSFNLSDSTHGSNRSSFDRDNDGSRTSGRVSRSSFNSDTESIKSSYTVTSENNPSSSPSQRRVGRSARDSIKSLSSFKENNSAKRQSVARFFLNESEDDFLLSIADNEWLIQEYIDAVLNGNLENVKRALEHNKIDPNALQADDFHALFAASGEGHLSVVHYLISKGSNVNFVAPVSLYSPLHAAATDGHVEVLEALLDAGAHINSVNINGWTPLWKATRSGQVEAVQTLIDRGADIDMTDLVGMTDLHLASKCGHFDIVKILLERGAKVNVLTQAGETPFFLCATSSDWVAEQGNLTCLLILKEFGADVNRPDSTGKTPEAEAGELLQPFFRLCHAKPGTQECLDLLKEDEHNLWFALIMANFKSIFVEELIKLHPILDFCKDARGRFAYDMASPLMKAAFRRSSIQTPFFSRTPKISRANSNILSQTQKDVSPTNIADLLNMMDDASYSLDEFRSQWAAKTMVEKETELRSLARDGALTDRHLAIMSDMDLNCVDSYGWTPLYEAIHHGHLQVVKLLFMKGAEVDITDKAGWSPVYLAAYYGHLDVLKFLAVKGCYVEQADKQGKKPIDVAQSEDVRHFLKNSIEEIRLMKREERLSEHHARKLSTGGVVLSNKNVNIGFPLNRVTDDSSKLSVHHYRSSRKESYTTSSKLSEKQMDNSATDGVIGSTEQGLELVDDRLSTKGTITESLPRLSISFAPESVNNGRSPRLVPLSPRLVTQQLPATASLPIDK